jgi:hypothetical protein
LSIIIEEVKMVYCSECGKKNDDVAKYCIICVGNMFKYITFEKNVEKFTEDFDKKEED